MPQKFDDQGRPVTKRGLLMGEAKEEWDKRMNGTMEIPVDMPITEPGVSGPWEAYTYPNHSGITPLDLVALVLPDPVEEITKGGIIIPETVQAKEKYHTQKATLIAVGKSCFVQWIEKPKPGDRVLIVQYAGTVIKGKDRKDYRIIKEDDLIAELEE